MRNIAVIAKKVSQQNVLQWSEAQCKFVVKEQ